MPYPCSIQGMLIRTENYIMFTMQRFPSETHAMNGKRSYLGRVNRPYGMNMFHMIDYHRYMIHQKDFFKTAIVVPIQQLEAGQMHQNQSRTGLGLRSIKPIGHSGHQRHLAQTRRSIEKNSLNINMMQNILENQYWLVLEKGISVK